MVLEDRDQIHQRFGIETYSLSLHIEDELETVFERNSMEVIYDIPYSREL